MKGLPKDTVDILAAAWRTGTKKQYMTYIKQWKQFCSHNGFNYLHVEIESVLRFLTDLFSERHLSYSALNTARSALATFLVIGDGVHTVGTHPLIIKFMRGVFNLRPPKPRYKEIWDVKLVFNYLRKFSPAKSLSLKNLTLKLVMLMALISAQRVQSLHLLNLEKMQLKNNKAVFVIDHLLKQSRPGNAGKILDLQAYPADRRLCVLTYLKQYIAATQELRADEKYLLISYKRPHKRISTQTVSRWIKSTLAAAGIDVNVYKAHSTRAAATSAAHKSDVPVAEVLEAAGWAKELTFRKYYKKPILNAGHFSNALLNSSQRV